MVLGGYIGFVDWLEKEDKWNRFIAKRKREKDESEKAEKQSINEGND